MAGWAELGSRAQSFPRALSHTAPVPAWHRLRSQSPSRVQTATSHNKWSAAHQVQQPWREEHVSADMFLDLPTMSAQ